MMIMMVVVACVVCSFEGIHWVLILEEIVVRSHAR